MAELKINETSIEISDDVINITINEKITDVYNISELIKYYEQMADLINGLPF